MDTNYSTDWIQGYVPMADVRTNECSEVFANSDGSKFQKKQTKFRWLGLNGCICIVWSENSSIPLHTPPALPLQPDECARCNTEVNDKKTKQTD